MLPMSEELKNTNGESPSLRTESIDRRRFLRRAAVTTAWAVPVISTFSAAPAFAQVPCVPRDQQCGTVSDCGGMGNPVVCTTAGFGACCTATLRCLRGGGQGSCSINDICVCR